MQCKSFGVRLRPCAFVGVALAAVTVATWGQGVSKASLRGQIDEEFSQRVKSNSSSSIVGAVLGDPSDQVNLSLLAARLPKSIGTSTVCFSATTSDGVYSATGVLAVSGDASGHVPIESQSFSKYAAQLAKYPSGAFTGMVTTASDCLDATRKAVILPLAFKDERKRLVVAINSGSALSLKATLRWGDGDPKKEIEANCGKVKAATTAFDLSCQFDLAPLKDDRAVDLLINKRPRAGPTREERYAIQLGV